MFAGPAQGTEGFVALSRFEVRPGWEQSVATAFQSRPGLVDDEPGFLRLEVIRPRSTPTEFWLLTFWTDEPSFRRWHRDHDRGAVHGKIPPGLKLVPGSAEVTAFDHVTS